MRNAPRSARSSRFAGFSYIEALVSLLIIMIAMGIAMTWFIDFGKAINTESGTLTTQQAGRMVLDELTRNIRQSGFGIRRTDSYNEASWQQGIVYAGSHVIAFNADIHDSIGPIPNTQTVSLPGSVVYTGEGIGATQSGAETLVYTIDANADGTIDELDRTEAETGSYNPAAETRNPKDFAVFRRIYGFDGTGYGGTLEPLAPYLFTNATADMQFPADGTTPAPLFTYWLTEDLNGDGVLAPGECVNDIIDSCPPVLARRPMVYLWGDTDFDGSLSEIEKAALLTMEVGSTSWSKNRLVSAGSYKSTTLSTLVDPFDPSAIQIEVTDGTGLNSGYHVQLGNGPDAEKLYIESVTTFSTPHRVVLSDPPRNPHAAGTVLQVQPTTVMRAIRAVEINYSSITGKKDSQGGAMAVGRRGRMGTRGLDYRVTAYRRKVEIINAPTVAAALEDTGHDICPLTVVNACNSSVSNTSVRYAGLTETQKLSFIVTDALGNPIPDTVVTFTNSDPSVGAVLDADDTSDSAGQVDVTYAPTGTLGDDTVTASVSCYLGGSEQTATATNTVSVYAVTTTMAQDCLSTLSTRTPAPAASFTVEVLSDSGPVSGHALELDLEFDSGFLPSPPDYTRVTGELRVGGLSVGSTDGSGEMTPVSVTSNGAGQIAGAVGLIQDADGEGTRLNLATRLVQPNCAGATPMLTDNVDFFKLTMDSTVPSPGCSEFLPCTIGATSDPPQVQAELSINGNPVAGAPLDFVTTDIEVPGVGDETAASTLSPDSGVVSDALGLGSVVVSNNGSPAITPATPLKTRVDVTSPGSTGYCTSGAIASSSGLVQFDFEAPATSCTIGMQQAWMSPVSTSVFCMHVQNANDVDGCPMEIRGLQILIYQADGITPDGTVSLKKILGGDVTSSPACSPSNAVTLFDKKCKSPQQPLANGEDWMFTDYNVCSRPFLTVDPQSFFNLYSVQFMSAYPSGRAMDVTIYYECVGTCTGGSTESMKLRLVTP